MAILVSKNEARMELGGISMRTLDTLISSKALPAVRIGKRILIRKADLERFARRDQPGRKGMYRPPERDAAQV